MGGRGRTAGVRTRGPEAAAGDRPTRPRSGARESVESFVLVFMGFLVWSIEAEGFVIPTGSMAPTLMGRHKEITCPECGSVYAVNADRESAPARDGSGEPPRIVRGTCGNCRYEADVSDAPSFSGDRIYVMKQGVALPFFANAGRIRLDRWDVAVFKLPEEPEVRYIKRLVGMPGEVLRVRDGDIWIRPAGVEGPFERPYRSSTHQLGMQVPVYDDRHRPAALDGDPAWRRWAPTESDAWTKPAPGRFEPSPAGDGWRELRYRHLVPSPDQWAAIVKGRDPGPPRASLITDFSSYNTAVAAADRETPWSSAIAWHQPHWVGDLALSTRLEVKHPSGRIRLELIKAGRSHRCEVDLSNGEVRLAIDDAPAGPVVATSITRPGMYDIQFANVDGRMTLWVDGALPFGDGVVDPTAVGTPRPTADDLEPVRIAAAGAEVAVSDLVVWRDVYYTLDPSRSDYRGLDGPAWDDPSALFDMLGDPGRFARLEPRPARDYEITPGHYLMLGDNSPASRDGRAWSRVDQIDPDRPGLGWDGSGRASWEVPERFLIGKAFCVYWPHLKPFWPNLRLGRDLRIPARPYIERIRWIR